MLTIIIINTLVPLISFLMLSDSYYLQYAAADLTEDAEATPFTPPSNTGMILNNLQHALL